MSKACHGIYAGCVIALVLLLGATTAKAEQDCADFSQVNCMVTMAWQHLTQWADAWSSKDYAAYVASYSAQTAPLADMTRAQWLAKRRAALAGAREIHIALHMIDAQYLAADSARVTVIQRYTAPHYSDIVLKTFYLGLVQGETKIMTEQTDRVLTPEEASAIINEFGY